MLLGLLGAVQLLFGDEVFIHLVCSIMAKNDEGRSGQKYTRGIIWGCSEYARCGCVIVGRLGGGGNGSGFGWRRCWCGRW